MGMVLIATASYESALNTLHSRKLIHPGLKPCCSVCDRINISSYRKITDPVIARLPVPESVFNNKKDRKNLRLIVRETFWTIEPAVKNKGYIRNVSMGGGNSVSKKRKILYNAPVDWEAKPESLIIKEREER